MADSDKIEPPKTPANTREDLIKQHCAIFEAKKTLRRNWDWQFEEQALYIMPGKADFITDRTTGDPARNKEIFDATAPTANHTLASHMHSALTNPANQWAELSFRDKELQQDDEAKEWIEDCTRRMFEAIGDSNFVATINETYQNLACFGTAVLQTGFAMDKEDGFRLVFRDVPLHACIFIENVQGQIDTVYHEVKLTARQAKQKWKKTKIEAVEKAFATNPEQELTFLKILTPNEGFDPDQDLNEKARRYECIWTYQKNEIKTEYHHEFEYQIPRWSKMTTEPYGYGLGTLAMPDIKTLNEAKRLELRSWEKAIDPPLLGQAGGVIGDLHLEAGGFTSVRDVRALQPLSDQANWQATQIKSQELRQNIQAIYLIDQLQLPERPNATATEVQIRYTMMQRVLGPTAGRLEWELLNPMINTIFMKMYRNDQFLPMPEGIAAADWDVKYVGPLARAQTNDDAQAIEKLLGLVAEMAQAYPEQAEEMKDVMEIPKMIRALSSQYGAPADVIRSEAEVTKLRKDREAMQAQQQALMQQQMQAQAAEAQQAPAQAELQTAQMAKDVQQPIQ